MGHATFRIEADSLTELLEKFREAFEKHPAMTLESATLVLKRRKWYTAIGDRGIEFAIDRAYGEKPKKTFCLILRVLP